MCIVAVLVGAWLVFGKSHKSNGAVKQQCQHRYQDVPATRKRCMW